MRGTVIHTMLRQGRVAGISGLRARTYHAVATSGRQQLLLRAPLNVNGTAHFPSVARLSSASSGSTGADEPSESAGKDHILSKVVTEQISEENSTTEKVAEPSESISGAGEDFEFKAETRKLLDIVASSLYSDKDVFVREIVSNCSDALEKLRYLQATEQTVVDAELDLEIHITTDEATGTFTIQDTGIGMSKQELAENLGTIARSGSKMFMSALEGADPTSAKSNIIGQFGVGFYSTFMVGTDVTVYSKSAKEGEPAHVWKSDGTGKFTIAEASNVSRGTKIVVNLNDECKKFAKAEVIQDVLEKHSNFVSYPIFLNGNRMNTVEALWTQQPSQVSEEDHKKFYKWVSGAWDVPMYTLHYAADAPVQLKALFYVGQSHTEKLGLGRVEHGVSLYSRKILILDKAPKLLPDWLRFIRGVVDSEDVPLNLSRELLQDSALLSKINSLLSARLVRFFSDQAKKDPELFNTFMEEFGNFFREGACTDRPNQKGIMKLMRYESSKKEKGELISLEEYIQQTPVTQKKIYYMVTTSRKHAETSPYMEALLQNGIEVLYSYEPLDEVVFSNVREFEGKEFVSVETSNVQLEGDVDKPSGGLTAVETNEFCSWLQGALGEERVTEVVSSDRLVSHPAIIADDMGSGAYRRMMRVLDKESLDGVPPQKLEVNPTHPLVVSLRTLSEKDSALATLLAEQLYDNALVYAGLMDDPRPMLSRVSDIMVAAAGGDIPKK